MTSRLPTGFQPPPQGRPVEQLALRIAQALADCGISDVGGERGATVRDGSQWSASTVCPVGLTTPRAGIAKDFLKCSRAGSTILGGMASLHIQVTDSGTREIETPPNQRIVMDLRWNSGRGGGEAQVDITRGGVFTLGAADTVQGSARIIPATDAFFRPGQDKRVEVTVCWGTSISPKAAMGTSEGITCLAGVATTPIAIPSQAAGMMVNTTDPANHAGLLAEWSRDAAGTRAYAAFNPYANMTPIVSGVEFVSFTTVANCVVIPTWELHL